AVARPNSLPQLFGLATASAHQAHPRNSVQPIIDQFGYSRCGRERPFAEAGGIRAGRHSRARRLVGSRNVSHRWGDTASPRSGPYAGKQTTIVDRRRSAPSTSGTNSSRPYVSNVAREVSVPAVAARTTALHQP